MITSVLGDIAPGSLGFCQSHEHIYIGSCPAQAGKPIDDTAKSAEELKSYRRGGGGAIVDAQPVGTGRDAEVLARLSRESGVHVIASTGFHKLSYYPEDHWVFSTGEDKLSALFVDELVHGMYLDGDTGFPAVQGEYRAGQIKTALDKAGLAGPYDKLFHAAVTAAKATGRPIMTHVEHGSNPVALADFLLAEGVPAAKTIFCHMDRAIPDIGVHLELCRRGIYLEYDTICRPKYHDDNRELEIIATMLDAGHGERLLLGLDTTRERLACYGGHPGLAYILGEFVPLMLGSGVSDADVRRMFVENPARVFCG